jgi:serine/threonine protein kinase
MIPLWTEAEAMLQQIQIYSHAQNKPVTIKGNVDMLTCIGIGTDAAVFQYHPYPQYAFKLYAPNKLEQIEKEVKTYEQLKGSPYHPTYYGRGNNYIVISYEEGVTLYDCLLRGITIPKHIVEEVDEAIEYARKKGLNPRDIHLKNILLQHNHAKLIDVSEYNEPGNDDRWKHLKKGYDNYYHLIRGKSVPSYIVETVVKWYQHYQITEATFDEFTQHVSKLINFKK